MYKLYLLLLFFQFYAEPINAQIDYRDEELKDNIQYFRKATVSFGLDTLVTFVEAGGNRVTKKVFLTVGTGVLFYFNFKNGVIPCVVTAKHVLRDSLNGWNPKSLNIRFGNQDSLPIDKHFGDVYHLRGELNQPIWLEHPDPSVDLAVFILDPTKEYSQNFGGYIPYSFIVSDEEYFEGREIFVLGYPGVVGIDLLHRAVLRRGIISWVPPDIQKSGNKILIDCSIFPGNSGGPVFLPSRNAGTILSDTVFQKPKFLGIVSQKRVAHNPIILNGKILTAPDGQPITSMESVSIGIIVTARKVRELLNLLQEDFTKWVEEEESKEKKKRK